LIVGIEEFPLILQQHTRSEVARNAAAHWERRLAWFHFFNAANVIDIADVIMKTDFFPDLASKLAW
jgi:hypothetical protein